MARAAGVSRVTVTAGVDELDGGAEPLGGRARRPGGGRKPLTGIDAAGLLDALDALVEPGGSRRSDDPPPVNHPDPPAELVDELGNQGHQVSHHSVGKLLAGPLDYSLQGNAKTLEGRQQPDPPDAQFRYIARRVALAGAGRRRAGGQRGREEEGADRPGTPALAREWRPSGDPRRADVHDFPGEQGKAVPYGVYDLGADAGWVSVGSDGDTAQFAVQTIRRWWDSVGTIAYPGTASLLITADAGGSNGYRLRLWKKELAALADATGLAITVCHMPPGTSKWNKIEHRLFSYISMNWAGQPLTSHEVAVNLIAGTTTRTGLTVRAERDTSTYPRGIKITDREMKTLTAQYLTPHDWHGEWNYTITPARAPS